MRARLDGMSAHLEGPRLTPGTGGLTPGLLTALLSMAPRPGVVSSEGTAVPET